MPLDLQKFTVCQTSPNVPAIWKEWRCRVFLKVLTKILLQILKIFCSSDQSSKAYSDVTLQSSTTYLFKFTLATILVKLHRTKNYLCRKHSLFTPQGIIEWKKSDFLPFWQQYFHMFWQYRYLSHIKKGTPEAPSNIFLICTHLVTRQ